MKKMVLMSIAFLVAIGLFGCSSDSDNKQEKNNEKARTEQKLPSKTINNVNIKVSNLKLTENPSGKKNILQAELAMVNNSNSTVGIGAGDFQVTAKGKTYMIYPEGNNFGSEISKGKKLKGSAYYEIPKGIKKVELQYKPVVVEGQKSKVLGTWNLNLPAVD
ncbi:DUF4352 domain-containing protein [Listeria aquatica]|uniref:DUF4352 domain-containing protein n=1 Tax=Listeria aquatica TaxID=1494960 RepID=A0A841ZN00_9LIST|nr:DUF4352 domain-containing protein [Listeria aquatica]MBC1520091.1 DUF4352 domain-containing protein [Listeria aquatica]